MNITPTFYYGTQYYRPPSPPEADWEKDIQCIQSHGFNVIKLFAEWSYIHVAPDRFDFGYIDRILDLCGRNGLKLIPNIVLETAPYWLIRSHPEARYQANDHFTVEPGGRSSHPSGGWPGLCLDNPPVREAAERFIEALAARYADSDDLYGYDAWNETTIEPSGTFGFDRLFCYCQATNARFVEWLRHRYGTIDELSKRWYRRYSDWGEVYPPRFRGTYPDWMDWLRFRLENQRLQMRWRVQSLRSADNRHPIISHGVVGNWSNLAVLANDNWDMASEVDAWGSSAFPLEEDGFLDLMLGADEARCSARGKPVWQNELQGGPAAQGTWRSAPVDGNLIRAWNWAVLSCGVKGLLYWQWRQEMLGYESPGYGLSNLDGSANERTHAARQIARLLSANPDIATSQPIDGEVGILLLPESQLFNFVSEWNVDLYKKSVRGIYQMFWNANIQADFLKIEDIDTHKLVYLPFPLLIDQVNAERLCQFVKGGGVLIADSAPAQYRDDGYANSVVPGSGLVELFGATQTKVDFIDPSNASPPQISIEESCIDAALYKETYDVCGGVVSGTWQDGTAAAVDNVYGAGKCRLFGTMLGIAACSKVPPHLPKLAKNLLDFGEVRQSVVVDSSQIKVRLHRAPGYLLLFACNVSRGSASSRITVSPDIVTIGEAVNLESGEKPSVENNSFTLQLDGFDGAVCRLFPEKTE